MTMMIKIVSFIPFVNVVLSQSNKDPDNKRIVCLGKSFCFGHRTVNMNDFETKRERNEKF